MNGSYQFDDAEMYPCDVCGEYLPAEEMYGLEDGRLVCERCLERMDSCDDNSRD